MDKSPVNKNEDQTGPITPVTDLQVRFTSEIQVAMDEENILIANRNTGMYRIWPRSHEKRLNRYSNWQSILDVSRDLIAEGDDLSEFNKEVEMLCGLMQIGVLEERSSDLSGYRLSNPENGWESAMRFLLETRTTSDTIFAIPEEYNSALAYKALLSRQPSAFYERMGVPVHPLSDPSDKKKGRAVRFEDVLVKRRTARRFSETPVTEAQLSALLYYGWGMMDSVDNPLGDLFLRKTSPSGGSLHPIEVYPVLMNIEGLPRGLFHYSVRRHALEEISLEDPREWIVEASGDQKWVAEAGVVFLCTAFLPRTAWKYQYSRVARAVISEIGFSGQAALLAATWLGLGSFTTIALRDQIWEEKLGLNPLREPAFAIFGAGQLEQDIEDHSRPRMETALGIESS